MKFHYLVTIEAPDAWVKTAKPMDGMTGRQWCENQLGSVLAHQAGEIPPRVPGHDPNAVAKAINCPGPGCGICDTKNFRSLLQSDSGLFLGIFPLPVPLQVVVVVCLVILMVMNVASGWWR